jgi:hypothetical protein
MRMRDGCRRLVSSSGQERRQICTQKQEMYSCYQLMHMLRACLRLQANSVQAFKKLLEAEALLRGDAHDHTTMCRFLKARKWEPEKALIMWKDMVQWRSSPQPAPADPAFTDPEIRKVSSNARFVRSMISMLSIALSFIRPFFTRSRVAAAPCSRQQHSPSGGPSHFWPIGGNSVLRLTV